MGFVVKNIVVGFDYSEEGFMALRAGLRMASQLKGCELHVLLVVRPASGATSDAIHIDATGATLSLVSAALVLRENVVAETRKAALRGEAGGLTRVVTYVRVGDAANEIVHLARSIQATGIVLGRARAWRKRDAASNAVAERVLENAPCFVYSGSGANGESAVYGYSRAGNSLLLM